MSRRPASRKRKVWTPAAVRALGVRTDVPTAGDVLGFSDRTAYDMVRRGTFPVPVLKLGNKLVVPTAPLLALLGIDSDEGPEPMPTRPALRLVPNEVA
jgi:hypothetical protein